MTDDIPELYDDFVAFAKTGIDTDFTVFKLYTRRLVDSETGEVGQFETRCAYQLTTLEQSPPPATCSRPSPAATFSTPCKRLMFRSSIGY